MISDINLCLSTFFFAFTSCQGSFPFKKYIIVEIIPTNSNSQKGFIAQLQALKVEDDKIINRLDEDINEVDNKRLSYCLKKYFKKFKKKNN